MSQAKKIVMISSTARDLPQHRKEVEDACLRQGMFPLMMEHLPANDDEAIAASLKMVDEADVYVGVFAHRYGYTPKGHDISVTEMEYNRAVERKIPRCIFVIDKNLPLADFTINDIDTGENAAKLASFKQRVETENIVNFFKSPADLRAHAINSLSSLRVPDLMAFHYVSDIPEPPEPFIAHPYTLLQTHRLVGRQPELNLLTDWVAKPRSDVFKAHIMNVVAIGGMGKSALTWKWFNEIAPQEMKPMAGRMWWSFYESDATFENFVTRALAYATRRPLAEVDRIPKHEREAQLLAALDREPFLIALDGLERMLIAYARMDAAHLSDDDYDRRTANFVANAYGLPASAAQSFTGERGLRKTADPRAGAFLRKLTTVRAARILVSTRLYPADLQSVMDNPLNNCFALFLLGMAEDDALELWRTFGATGARDQLLPVFRSVENHPLLIQSLAGEVARFRRAPGDFDAWRRAHPDFNPFRDIPLVQVKSHVLEYALRGLKDRTLQVLQTIAAFRMPAQYDTLATLLVAKARKSKSKPVVGEKGLDVALAELEDRGLVGWDKRANRYDLHPIVRGVVWSGLGDDGRRGVYTNLYTHFEAVPKIDNYLEVNCLEDLTPAIELYNTLIGLGQFDEAYAVFRDRLEFATLYRLNAGRQRVELLETIFPDGLDQAPRLRNTDAQAVTLNSLATGYLSSGQPGRAPHLLRRHNVIRSETKTKPDLDLSSGLNNLSYALRLLGALCEAEFAARRALIIARTLENRFRESLGLQRLGVNWAAQGMAEDSISAMQRTLRIRSANSEPQGECYVSSDLAQRSLWFGALAEARAYAERAWELAHVMNYEADFIRAARVQGAAALGLGDFTVADERLHHALTRARQVNHAEEELPALIALAELRRREGKPNEARELLDDVWDGAERGPYPLFRADAFNVLAQIERDASNRDAAVVAATQAYRLAWCDGPPFAYHWGLEAARKHLRELGAPEPEMPPFDPSKHEPMPEVEIDPEDEFHVGAQP
jgi:tetratricopeptide (TPR) repeat protein